MSDERSSAPLASFESKWSEAYPEFGLALRFLRGADRDEQGAFACLAFEIEHAAFAIREAQPAAIKLQWWADELARAAKGESRHPLTQVLGERIAASAISAEQWQSVVVGAFAQRDAEPAADGTVLLAQYAELYAPLGAIEAALFGTHATSIAGVLARRRALREAAALRSALQDGKLPLPLDLLASHRLTRGNLGAASEARGSLLREWFGRLGDELAGFVKAQEIAAPTSHVGPAQPLGIVRATMAAADAVRAERARRARDPLAALNEALGTLSIPVAWSAWRAARRSRA